jgi:hypothetical protein
MCEMVYDRYHFNSLVLLWFLICFDEILIQSVEQVSFLAANGHKNKTKRKRKAVRQLMSNNNLLGIRSFSITGFRMPAGSYENFLTPLAIIWRNFRLHYSNKRFELLTFWPFMRHFSESTTEFLSAQDIHWKGFSEF